MTLKSSFYYLTPVLSKLEKRLKEWIVCFFKNSDSLNPCLLECTPVAVSFHGGKITKNIIKMLITSRNTPAAEYTSSLSICMLNMLQRLIVLPKNGWTLVGLMEANEATLRRCIYSYFGKTMAGTYCAHRWTIGKVNYVAGPVGELRENLINWIHDNLSCSTSNYIKPHLMLLFQSEPLWIQRRKPFVAQNYIPWG